MRKRASNAILSIAAGLTLAGGCSAAMVSAVDASGETVKPNSPSGVTTSERSADRDQLTDAWEARPGTAESEDSSKDRKSVSKQAEEKKANRLPNGSSTATSFWDPETASGRPMAFRTLASPYWPLGTKVKITYQGKSTVGVVDDFGPAEWAVAQHDPPAIIDLSEKMMAKLSGSESDVVQVKFQVLEMGDGPSYRKSGSGRDAAFDRN